MLTKTDIRRYYEHRIQGFARWKSQGGWWRGPCPIHKGKRDSFAVHQESGGWICHSECQRGGSLFHFEMRLYSSYEQARESVSRILGRADISKWCDVETYDYTDEEGNLLFQVVRRERMGEKKFLQRRPLPNGGWEWKRGSHNVPYRLPKLRDARTVYIAEGEKDVHTLEKWGLVATCNAGGAGKWDQRYSEWLRHKDIVIVPDRDLPGQQHALVVAQNLLHVATSIRIVQLEDYQLTREHGKDITDWVQSGGTADAFRQRCETAEVVTQRLLAELTHSIQAEFSSTSEGQIAGLPARDFTTRSCSETPGDAPGFGSARVPTRRHDWRNPITGALEVSGGIHPFLERIPGLAEGDGVTFPWRAVNERVKMRPKMAITLAARSSVGKSAMALQIGMHVAMTQGGVAIVSLEMDICSIARRMIATQGIDLAHLENRRLSVDERKRVQRILSGLSDLPIWVNDSLVGRPAEIREALSQLRADHPLSMVIVDHLR
jgi:hypothetical protein